MTAKDSWIKENTAALIALGYTGFSFIVYLLILTHTVSTTENITFLIINSITNIAMIIVGYHFGSSAGSKSKQEAMDKLKTENTISLTDNRGENKTL